MNSFPMCLWCVKSFLFKFWILNPKVSLLQRLHIGRFETQITCDFENFLGPVICEIVPDYIKKVTILRNLN